MLKKISCALALLVMTSSAVAAIQCPGNTSFVSLGDSISAVQQACGAPSQTIHVKAATTVPVEVWQFVSPARFNAQSPTSVTIAFRENKVVAIRYDDGTALDQTDCPNGSVALGDSQQDVSDACGTPFKQKMMNVKIPSANNSSKKVHLIYKPQSYLPATTFIFEDGKLVGTQN